MLIPVILAGGRGIRLWPLSRETYPKQFLHLYSDHYSLLQETLLRLQGLKAEPPIIVCPQAYQNLVQEQCRSLGQPYQAILLEPLPRNTAPAIALASHWVCQHNDPQKKLLILPADHFIPDKKKWLTAIKTALKLVQNDQLVTFGIRPISPETAYGYLYSHGKLNKLSPVKKFIEKPPLTQARQFIKNKNYYWNSGIFLFSAHSYLNELANMKPSLFRYTQKAIKEAESKGLVVYPQKKSFEKCENTSIDYAVMQNTKQAVMLPCQMPWNDVGSWNALFDTHKHNKQNNVIKGKVIEDKVSNCYIQSNRLVAASGLRDLIIVDTMDALLVMNKKQSQSLKNIIAILAKEKNETLKFPSVVHRPWGTYETIFKTPYFLVKKIVVYPGQKLSLQLHYHRSEHWIVVEGELTVTHGDKTFKLGVDQNTYIPCTAPHRMANETSKKAEVIEVQIGNDLREEDIVRLEDVYGRV